MGFALTCGAEWNLRVTFSEVKEACESRAIAATVLANLLTEDGMRRVSRAISGCGLYRVLEVDWLVAPGDSVVGPDCLAHGPRGYEPSKLIFAACHRTRPPALGDWSDSWVSTIVSQPSRTFRGFEILEGSEPLRPCL